MTFEQTMQTIYGIFCKNIGNAETIELCREIEKPIEALQAEYDRELEENNQLKAVIAEHKGTDSNSDNSTLKPASLNPYYAFETYMKTWQLNPRKKYDVQVKKGNAFIYYLDSTLEPVEYVSSGGGCMVEFKFTSPLQEEPILVSSGSDHLFAIRESNTQGASNDQ